MNRSVFPRPAPIPARGKSRKAPEGMLLLVLLISVLLVVFSLIVTRGPAAGVFTPIEESSN